METPLEERWLDTRHIGRPLRIFTELDSTNTQALRCADDPARHGLTLLAHTQSSGRGQYGRSWQAPPKSSVLMSALLFSPPPLRRPVLLTSWAAVAVCDLLREVADVRAAIKWPNDVIVAGKKVCGILIEQRTTAQPSHPLATVVGIGLNVTQTADDFVAANLPLGGSILSVTGQRHDSDEIALRLISHLDRRYQQLCDGDFTSLQTAWTAGLGLLGREVTVELADRNVVGQLLELTFDGVILAGEDGLPICLAPETIRHLSPLGS